MGTFLKRIFWILITPLVFFTIAIGAIKIYALPQVEAWALTQLQDYSEKKLPVRISAKKINIFLLKPSVSVEDIEITPNTPETEKVFDHLTIRNLRAHLDLFQLLAARFQISVVVIDSPAAQIKIDSLLESKEPAKALPMDQIFSLLEKIPLDRIFLQNIFIDIISEKEKFSTNLRQSSLLITNMNKILTAKLEVPDLRTSLPSIGDFSGALDTHLYLTKQTLRILRLGVRLNDSEMSVRGEIPEIKNVTLSPQGKLNISAKLNLKDIYQELKRIKPQLKIPSFEGKLIADSEINFKESDIASASAQIKTEKVIVDQFQIGDASVQGKIKGNTIQLSEFKVAHPAGEAALNKTEIQFDENLKFKTNINIQSLDLQKLFVSLNLKNIPVGVQTKGELPCSGQFTNPLKIECDAKLEGKNVWVWSDLKNPKSEIVAIDDFKAEGKIELDAKAIKYKANLSIANNTGTSDGEVDFENGFHVNFKTNQLEFKNIKNLAHLNFLGTVALDGFTEGDSHSAIFDIKTSASDFVFEGYTLGTLTSDLKYRSGHLFFENVLGVYNKTQYSGNIDLDLLNSKINGQVKVPSTNLVDVAKILENLYHFPFEITGAGKADIKFNGPLDFWQLSYNLESNFKNIVFGTENFDSLTFNVNSENGDINTRKVIAQKNNSTLIVTGNISADKELNLKGDLKNFKLEESDTISKISSNLFGSLFATTQVTGTIQNPKVDIRGEIRDTVIEDQEIAKSTFNVEIDKSKLNTEMNMFGDRIQGSIVLPLNNSQTPLKINIKTNDWAFAPAFTVLGAGNLLSDYDSSLSTEINLFSENGSIENATGQIDISDIYLKRGNLSLRNGLPISIRMNNGNIAFKDFYLEGPQNQISITGQNFNTHALDFTVSADVELRLLHILLPFLEDLGGTVNTSASFSGSITNPKILGNLNLSNGFVKVKGLPHAFEKIQSDVSFSHAKILINEIKAQFAGGTLNGDGTLNINGPRDVLTNIRARIEGASLNIPDKVKTTGNADVVLTGKWFPFTLSGTYRVSSGFIDKEFGNDASGFGNIKQSAYLPKSIKVGSFEPLLLDLQVLIEKSITIKNSLIDGFVNGNLNVKGSPQNPILSGKVSFDKNSKLLFKDKVFEVQTGQVQFNNPNEIDPEIYLSAQSRVSEYDIALLVQGPAKNMNIRVSSVPPLSDQDIISLLALGVTSTKLDQSVQSKDQQTQTSYEIGAAIIGAPINKQLQNTFGLNLQFSSTYDSTRNISVPKVTISRKLKNNLTVSGSRSIVDQNAFDVKLQYLINQNFSAVGSFEKKEKQDTGLSTSDQDTQSFFGIDLEFKREFK